MNDSYSTSRALVLGGGGAVGNAWLIGMLAGLADGGLDVTVADLVVGTSAGATAAAQIGGASPAELYASVMDAPRSSAVSPRGPIPNGQLERTAAIIAQSAGPEDMRRRIGANAIGLAEASGDAGQARWRETVAARFSPHEWPARRTILTVVNAETGEPAGLEAASGVGLVDAVAASTAGGPAYRIAGTWYIDGGYRTNADNADLAAGYRRVLILSPLGGRTRLPAEWGLTLAHQIRDLRAAGSAVETILPDATALAAFGSSMMDLSVRPAAARAGFAQGNAAALGLREFWG